MAELNMNYFHLHATDDEGWRLEIPELPELTSGHSLIISRSFLQGFLSNYHMIFEFLS